MIETNNQSSHDPLDPQDRILWDAVRATMKSMHGEDDVEQHSVTVEFAKAMEGGTPILKNTLMQPSFKQPLTTTIHPFDRPTHRKISKGRVKIEARVDLHGLIQSEAYSLLLHFLQSAQHRGLRHVLVVTGKGSSLGSEGVLRQSVPHWLKTAPFRLFVSAFEDAARHHGGQGALYIRLRRLISEGT